MKRVPYKVVKGPHDDARIDRRVKRITLRTQPDQARLVARFPLLVRVFEDEERSLPEALRRELRRRERDHAQRWVDALRLLRPDLRPSDLEILAYSAVGMILAAPRWPKPLRNHPQLEAKLVEAAWRILSPA